jgi:signal transduction histidine kinase
MTGAGARARLNGRLAHAAVGRQLPYRTVRLRLTLLYGGLFLASGAALMAIAYLLLINAGFVFSLPGSTASSSGAPISKPAQSAGRAGFPHVGESTHPSARTMAYWRAVAGCMHGHGIALFPDPVRTVPARLRAVTEVSNRNGAILVFPAALKQSSAAFTAAATTCGYYVDDSAQLTHVNGTRTQVREQLLLRSALALGVMALLSLGLGWFLAGHALEPLEAADQAQRRFVANASHELRAPLTRQRTLIQVALADPGADERSLRAAHERVLAAEQQLEQIIDGLLTLTRGQAGPERIEHVDLADRAAEAVHAHEAEAATAGLTVQMTLGVARARGDQRLLDRLLANLMANAVRHNRAGGSVEVITGTRDRAPFVSVRNSGPVVGAEQVQRLLQPFERMGEARTGHERGHGLGLSIVGAIAEAHRAQLRISPQPEGGLLVEVVFAAMPAAARRPLRSGGLRRGQPRATLGE